MRRRTTWVAIVAAFAAVNMPARAATAFVHAVDFSWVPQHISIQAGDTVQWGNDDDVTHSVTELSCERAGGSGTPCLFNFDVNPGSSVSYPFATPGVVEYKCAIHIFFGKVTVVGPADALPDLVVASLGATPASATAPLTLRLTAAIRNASSLAAAGRSEVVFQYRTGAGPWRTIGATLGNQLAPGGQADVRILWNVTGKAGDFEIRALADGNNQVAESDEANNTLDAGASILVPAGTVSPGIDLIPEGA